MSNTRFCGRTIAGNNRGQGRRLASGGGRPEPSFLQANFDVMSRGKKSITLDLKKPEGKEALLKLVATADALIEGFRPGVMEHLGLGPEVCLERNPRLVYGRMTG